MKLLRLLPLGMLVVACAAEPPPPPILSPPPLPPPAPVVNVPNDQRRATVRIEATLPDDVKDSFIRAVKTSRVPDAIGELGVAWTSRGSGFFLRTPGGNGTIVVTNKHVVDSAPKVTLLLDDHASIHDCDVIYVDEKYDVAIINVPTGIFTDVITHARLATADPQDNDTVQAVGFPAIGTVQSFRTTAGVISNSNFSLPGQKITFLQHTAAIDPGSSGGPLFRKDSLDVLGINTLAIPANNNLYSAVPAKTVDQVIKKAFSAPPIGDIDAASKVLGDTCEELMDELGATGRAPPSTVAIVSDYLVSNVGIKVWDTTHIKVQPAHLDPETNEFVQARTQVDTEAFAALRTAVQQGDVLEYLRNYTFERLYADVKTKGGVTTSSCRRIVGKDLKDYDEQGLVRVRVEFASGEHRTLSWRYEQGHWRLAAYDE